MDLMLHGSTVALVVVGTGVGFSLLLRARRERRLPELAVGLALLSYAAMAQAGRYLSTPLGEDAEPMLLTAATTYRVIGYLITLGGLSVFTWQVFGAKSRWRQLLAGTMLAVGLVSAVAMVRGAWILYTGGPPSPPLWRVMLSGAFLTTFLWTSIESLRYHGLMRRRLALGLADPVIANRFLLWGGGAGLSTALTIVPVVTAFSGPAAAPVSMLATTAAGLLNALVWWLSFTPPAAYLRWVRSRWGERNASADAPT